MPGPHKGVSTQHNNQQVLANLDTNLRKETSRPEKG